MSKLKQILLLLIYSFAKLRKGIQNESYYREDVRLVGLFSTAQKSISLACASVIGTGFDIIKALSQYTDQSLRESLHDKTAFAALLI